jgi:anti-sigma-K factor RskA
MVIIKMDIQRFLNSGILEKYVLGLASPEEMERVERLAKEYPEVDKHICQMQNCMEEYAEMHSVRPPRHLKKRILSVIDETETSASASSSTYRVPSLWKWGAGIAAATILALGAWSMILYQNQQATLNNLALLTTQVKHLQKDQETLQVSARQIEQKYSVLKDVTTRHVALKGSNIAPQSLAVVYWNPDHNKGYLNIVNLPPCPSGHEYQMWADVNGKHVDMGMLKVDENGAVLHNIPYIEGSRGFVITLEKAGGSKHPTVEKMFAAGNI